MESHSLSDLEPAETSIALQKSLSEGLGVNEALIEILGIGYTEAGQLLLKSWGIPDMLSQAVARDPLYKENHPVDQVSILETARKVCKTLISINKSMFSKTEVPVLSDDEMLSFNKLEATFEKTVELSERLV